MFEEKKQDAICGPEGSVKDIKRMELLTRRFSAAEIDRLMKWQLRYRARVDALDLPADEYRLRFARWLVEHGMLSEEVDRDPNAPDRTPLCEAQSGGDGKLSPKYTKYMPIPPWSMRPTLKRSRECERHRSRWRQLLSRLVWRLRGGIGRTITGPRVPSWP